LVLLYEREALDFFRALGTFLSVVSAFVVSQKPDFARLFGESNESEAT
jgi:hypothetical protein